MSRWLKNIYTTPQNAPTSYELFVKDRQTNHINHATMVTIGILYVDLT